MYTFCLQVTARSGRRGWKNSWGVSNVGRDPQRPKYLASLVFGRMDDMSVIIQRGYGVKVRERT